MSKILVCGGDGFIGHHLVKRLVKDGHEVTAIGRKHAPEFEPSPAHQYIPKDLTTLTHGDTLFSDFDEVYQLAAEVGGLGYILDQKNDATCLRNSMQINLNVLECCRINKIPKVFFASSACIYPDHAVDHEISPCHEEADIWVPDNAYAIEKRFAEELYAAYAANHGLQVRIARFHNCFGPLGTWQGGREKAPAALCRKVAQAEHGTSIEMWGDGTQTRSFMYVDDAVEGAVRLMASGFQGPVNIGSSRLVALNDLAELIIGISTKWLTVKHIDGPIGVQGRNSDNTLIKEKLGWEPVFPLELGLLKTYQWIAMQVAKQRKTASIDGVDIRAPAV